MQRDYGRCIHLEFDTNRSMVNGKFFSSTRWNEKIKWIGVKINAEEGGDDEGFMVYLEQSGTALVRNRYYGFPPPGRPDMLVNEMTGYPTRYWYIDRDGQWASRDYYGFAINARISVDPDEPDSSWRKAEFHELPCAVSRWILEVPLEDASGKPLLEIDKINDIELWFYNYYYAGRLTKKGGQESGVRGQEATAAAETR